MGETMITVSGTAELRLPPERATVGVTVHFDGPEPEPVLRSAAEVANGLTAGLRELSPPTGTALLSWSSGQLRTWSARPWNQDGRELPLVHHAAVVVEAEFVDFDALARWLAVAGRSHGVSIGPIDWTVHDETRDRSLIDVRTRAVQDAVAKARVYAAAVGLAQVTPTAISEPDVHHAPVMMRAMAAADGDGSLELTPDEITVEARVEVRFSAS
jgi:uncharacterized protein